MSTFTIGELKNLMLQLTDKIGQVRSWDMSKQNPTIARDSYLLHVNVYPQYLVQKESQTIFKGLKELYYRIKSCQYLLQLWNSWEEVAFITVLGAQQLLCSILEGIKTFQYTSTSMYFVQSSSNRNVSPLLHLQANFKNYSRLECIPPHSRILSIYTKKLHSRSYQVGDCLFGDL